MRKSVIVFISMAVAAVTVLSCSKEKDFKDKTPDAAGITINALSGETDTRTMAVDGDVPTIQWVNTDQVAVFEVVDGEVAGAAYSEAAVIDAEGRASFSTTLNWDDPEGLAYKYSAIYPANAATYYNEQYYIILPEEQALVGNNFSEDSDILFSTPLDHGTTRATDGEDVMFSFRRLGTVVRLRLNGIGVGEKISQVTLTAPTYVAGAIAYDPVTSTVDSESAFQVYGSNTIVLSLDDLEATGDDVVWFRVMAERDWVAGDEFGIQVVTDKNFYQKEVTLPSSIKFPDGGLTKFGVGLTGTALTASYEDYLGEWSNGGKKFTVEQKVDGVSYSISGLTGQGKYPVEAVFERHQLVVYEQVVYSEDNLDVALQGTDGYYPNYPWTSPSVIFSASYDETEDQLNITPGTGLIYYLFMYYEDQEVVDYDLDEFPSVLTRYEPDPTAYIYFEDFEEGADDWTLLDADGDGYGWMYNNSESGGYKLSAHSGSGVLFSQSYNGSALTPDNWAFTPAISLTSDNYLSFWVVAQDPDWADEHYAAYITETAPSTDNLADCTVLLKEQVCSGDYNRHIIQIPSDFNGKTVYIGFRHFNCTDMFYINLDDVGVSEGAPITSKAPAFAPAKKAAAPKVQARGSRKDASQRQIIPFKNEVRKVK